METLHDPDPAMSRGPKVSVIIPCYNLGAFLDETVDSALQQTYQDLEIVIVNDGSTDPATNELLRDYRRPRTRVLHTENRGLAGARNMAISAARGEYICALDADDRLHPEYIEKAVAILDADPDVAFVSSWLETFGDEQWTWKQDRCDLATLLGECTVCTAALVRTSAVLAVGGFDEHMPDQGYEDWDLWISLVKRGFTGTIIPEVMFYYRRRAGSMSSICCSGDPHQRLMRYLVGKHHESYDLHLLEVLGRKDRDTAEVLRENLQAERHIQTWLEPEVERRREELASLRRKLQRAEDESAVREQRDQLASRVAELEQRMADEEAGGHLVARIAELEDRIASGGPSADDERTRLADLADQLSRKSWEADSMRQSRSWKLTAPLRIVHDMVARLLGRTS